MSHFYRFLLVIHKYGDVLKDILELKVLQNVDYRFIEKRIRVVTKKIN